MRLVFAGTPEFAAESLAALIAGGHDIVLVLTQPDRPAGRGMRMHASPVKALATSHAIPVLQPQGLRPGGKHDADARLAHERLAATAHDAMVVAAYGLILPPSILALPPRGCINVHASLLPRWRGAAPIQRAIEAGDADTGITIMQMDAGLDTGAILLTRSVAIGPADTAASLTATLAMLGGEAIVEALARLGSGTLAPRPQHPPGDDSAVTYAAKLSKSEAPLDFTQGTRALVDRIRAFDPWPGCSAELIGADQGVPVQFKVWKAVDRSTGWEARPEPGRVLRPIDESDPGAGVLVATADGAIALTELQKAGGRRLPARHFAHDFIDASLRFAAA